MLKISLYSLSCESPFKYFGNTLQVMRVSFGVPVGSRSGGHGHCSRGTNEGSIISTKHEVLILISNIETEIYFPTLVSGIQLYWLLFPGSRTRL